LNSIFFGEPCGKSGKHAGRATGLARRRPRGHRGDDDAPAARRSDGRADVCPGGGEPGRLLPPLAGLGAAPGGDGGARCDPAHGPGEPALWLSADRGAAAPRRAGGQPQARAAADAAGQSAVPARASVRAGDDGLASRMAAGSEPGARSGAERPRSVVGRRHHLCAARRRVRLPGGAARRVQPAGHRLGPGAASAGEPCHGGPADGDRRAAAGAGQPDPPFRPGRSVRLRRVHGPLGSARHPAEHEPGRQSLRQRQGRASSRRSSTRRSTGGTIAISIRRAPRSAPSSRRSTTASDCTRPSLIGRPSSSRRACRRAVRRRTARPSRPIILWPERIRHEVGSGSPGGWTPSPAPPPSLACRGERATVAPGGWLRASPPFVEETQPKRCLLFSCLTTGVHSTGSSPASGQYFSREPSATLKDEVAAAPESALYFSRRRDGAGVVQPAS
jgi:hypothetical protein